MEDDLLIRFLLKESNEDENERVYAWLKETPENAAYYSAFETIWLASRNLRGTHQADPDLAWEKFKERRNRSEGKRQSPYPFWMKIAASILLIGMAWTAYQVFDRQRNVELLSQQEVLTRELPDGSALTLNKNALLSYGANFNEHRDVELKRGEVFFEVAHDKSRPFVVHIGQLDVTVVGTSFNIKRLQQETEVIVETGLVRVEHQGQQLLLHPGEKVTVGPDAALKKQASADQLYNYYRTGLFVPSNTPLKKLLAVLEEAYGERIVLSQTELGEEPVNTTLPFSKSLKSNLETLAYTLKLQLTRNETGYSLSRDQ